MAYANTTELADYLGVDEADLSPDAPRLLERASDLIDYITRNKIDVSIVSQEDAARKATCAQYEWWAETGDELGIISQLNSMSIGEFSFSGGSSQTNQNRISIIAPRVEQYLFLEGLLYGGVDLA